MINLHFLEPNEKLPDNWETEPSIRAGAEKYRDYLISKDKARTEFEKANPNQLYLTSDFPIIDEFFIRQFKSRFNVKSVRYICLEYKLGEEMFMDWKWNTPEVQKSYTESKVAANDWYKQFDSNPDGASDYLDNLKDRSEYLNESRKIEKGIKEGKYENR